MICLLRGSTHHLIKYMYQGNTHYQIPPMRRNQLRKEEFRHDPVSDVYNTIMHGMNCRTTTCVHISVLFMHYTIIMWILILGSEKEKKKVPGKENQKNGKRKA